MEYTIIKSILLLRFLFEKDVTNVLLPCFFLFSRRINCRININIRKIYDRIYRGVTKFSKRREFFVFR